MSVTHFLPERPHDAIGLKLGLAWSLGTITAYKMLDESQELASFDFQRWPCCSGDRRRGD